MKRDPVGELLRRAYARGVTCPPPEVFLENAWRELPASEGRRIEEHAKGCPACSAERDLARTFDDPDDAEDVRSEDVAYVVSKLGSGGGANAQVVVPFASARAPARARASARWWLAAAAMFVAAIGTVTTYRSLAPKLPSRAGKDTLRGAVVEAEGPLGEVATLPRTLRWSAVEGAASYTVRIKAVDGVVLWEASTPKPSVDLPEDVRKLMHPAVVYSWEVDALDAQAARIASSGEARFRARPGAQ